MTNTVRDWMSSPVVFVDPEFESFLRADIDAASQDP